ncbi:MAG: ABC transporter permease subunit [Propionicimonas sp.]|uniref:ABC transporter permease n=1 Tax=Propionicimonas sp. TaxID=1955623 RepID=UPI001D9C96ED|nr:ABC transporter permease subunit [Propionicimonas sp.]MBU4188672.1 ABC transporter permease subunit [Actinomycetota bacterium]MBU4205470.1 ABC transporter permease subunit [Actinomycetota bacterium]MBU4248735.1 ABC transporter permease subunit [Actinomycetota bacterium]MBU4410876.1 ABC transporter permease subunit [Actinomycetota bacterium]MBU4417181.1 ABC transporter permease subunit [Actinomycetota bacterium]
MNWFLGHLDEVGSLMATHAVLASAPLLAGLLLAIPLGWLARRYRLLRTPLIVGTGLLYTIPSLALFILMPLVLGTGILDPLNVVVALTVYTVALLVRTVSDGLASVPDDVLQAASAMGIGRVSRFLKVELPLAVPVISAGLRVAAVSNVSIVSVAALLGIAQLGSLFTDGFARNYLDPIVVGILACIALALVFDLLIVALTKVATPWLRVGSPA